MTLQVDASDSAIGGVLLQDGHPVCFTSHTLSATEKNYAQIEKECLAIVSCMEKWHHYLYGKQDVTVHSNHQPLETIFKKPLSRAPRGLQRMMFRLQNYHFTVQYKKGKELFVADCGVLWISETMNSGHVAERVCVHVCMSGTSKGDFVLLELLTLVASRNTTLATRMVQI